MDLASAAVEMESDRARIVLVIDDDAPLRNALREYLELCGLRVRVAADAREAIIMLRSIEFDAVVSDVMMPGNGHTVIEYVHFLQPETPVIVVTAQERSGRSTIDAFACLTKPVAPEQFIRVLNRAFTQHRHSH
jgi:two-component system, NtrC family, C4-dicarboxylate transport response regulator DctD